MLVFAQPVTFSGATVDAGTGGTTGSVTTTPAAGPASEVIVNFTASNAQKVTVNLLGVSAGGAANPVSVPMSLLLGDVNQTKVVDGNDVSAVQGKTRQPVSASTFQYDVNVTGTIDGNDVSTTQGKTRTRLP